MGRNLIVHFTDGRPSITFLFSGDMPRIGETLALRDGRYTIVDIVWRDAMLPEIHVIMG